jgi:hypothetical protein
MLTAREKAAFFMGASAMLHKFGSVDVDAALVGISAAAVRAGCWPDIAQMAPELIDLVDELKAIQVVIKT